MIKIYLKGPLLTQSGYGHHARTVYRALRTREDLFDIYVQPIAWGKTSWEWRDTEERRALDECLNKTIQYINSGGKFDVSIQVTIPNEWEQLAPINIGVTAGIESDRISSNWLQKSNMMTKIVTISEHAMSGFVNTVYDAVDNQTGQQLKYSLQTPIEYVPYPVLKSDPTGIDLDLSTNFNFLTVAQMGPRKNLGATIDAFVDAFGDNPDAGLIIKTNIGKNSLLDRVNSATTLRSAIEKHGERKCKIYLLHGSMTEGEMASLYTHEKVKCIVSTTHGEGYGLPLFEAAYSGLPVVATGWSGHLDFLVDEEGNEHFYNVAFDLQPVQQEVVWNGVLIKESMWAYAREQSAKEKMRLCYNQMTNEETRGTEMIALEQNVKRLHETFSADKMYDKFVSLINEAINFNNSENWLNEISDIIKEYE